MLIGRRSTHHGTTSVHAKTVYFLPPATAVGFASTFTIALDRHRLVALPNYAAYHYASSSSIFSQPTQRLLFWQHQ